MFTPSSLTSSPIQSLASPPVTWVSPETVTRIVSLPLDGPTSDRPAPGRARSSSRVAVSVNVNGLVTMRERMLIWWPPSQEMTVGVTPRAAVVLRVDLPWAFSWSPEALAPPAVQASAEAARTSVPVAISCFFMRVPPVMGPVVGPAAGRGVVLATR